MMKLKIDVFLVSSRVAVRLISEKVSSVTSSHMIFFYVSTVHIGYISAADQFFVFYIQKFYLTICDEVIELAQSFSLWLHPPKNMSSKQSENILFRLRNAQDSEAATTIVVHDCVKIQNIEHRTIFLDVLGRSFYFHFEQIKPLFPVLQRQQGIFSLKQISVWEIEKHLIGLMQLSYKQIVFYCLRLLQLLRKSCLKKAPRPYLKSLLQLRYLNSLII